MRRMGLLESWRKFWNPIIVIAFDRDSLWITDNPDREAKRAASCVALDIPTNKVRAVGDDALAMESELPPDTRVVHYVKHGSLIDFDIAEAAFKYEIRLLTGNGLRIAPRILLAAPVDVISTRVIKDAATHAGARLVHLVPRLMAAALGDGLDVKRAKAHVIAYVDRDQFGLAVISDAKLLAQHEACDSLEQVAYDMAWAERKEGDQHPAKIDTICHGLRTTGVADNSFAASLVLRWRERYLETMQSLSPEYREGLRQEPVYLTGPYANVPGLKELLSTHWERPFIMAKEPAKSVIRGCQILMREIDDLMKPEKSR